jgi:CheY-like chemotaxis protein
MKSRLIFVVDDDRLMQNLLEYTICSKEGFEVNVFKNSEDCLQNLEKKPDVIILDHHFIADDKPVMTGLEALVEIRKREKSLPVIILSGQNNDTLIEEYYSKGATSYISKKGYFITNLLETCDQVL